jgi:hypothetical protein
MHRECENHIDTILLSYDRMVTSLEADVRCHADDNFQNRIFQFFQIVVSNDRRSNSMGCVASGPGYISAPPTISLLFFA